MKLVLDIVKSGRIAPQQKNFHFNESGGAIGRNDDCDWVLTDLNSYISGQHATIISKHGTYFIVDESTNGTFLKNPYKKLPKGHPYKINPSDVFIVGDHELQARFSNNDYTEDDIVKGFAEEPTIEQIIPNDDFLTEYKIEDDAESILNTAPEIKDDFAYIDAEVEEANQNSSIDDFLNNTNDQDIQDEIKSAETVDDFSQEHINVPSFADYNKEQPREHKATTSSKVPSGLLSSVAIFENKLGIEISSLDQEERDVLMNELGEIILCSLDYLQNSLNIKDKTKQDLHITSNYFDTKDTNPIRLGSNSLKLLQNKNNNGLLGMMKISDALKDSFKGLDAHCIALHSATKNIMKVAITKFSPINLEHRFESNGSLKGVLPRAQLLWRAYENMFAGLNDRPEDGVEMIKEDFSKEYENTLYSLNLHTNEIKDK